MPSVQEFRDSQGSLIASGVAYVISMKLELRHGGHEIPTKLFAPAKIGKYEERVLEAFKDVLGPHGGLWGVVAPKRTINFNLVSYRDATPTTTISFLDQLSQPFGRNRRIATVTENLILDCLAAAVAGVEEIINSKRDVPIKVVATWTPGPDLTVKDAGPVDASQSQQRLSSLEQLRRNAQKKSLIAGLISIVLIVVGSSARLVMPIERVSQALMVGYGLLIGVVALSNRATAASATTDIEAARAQQDLSELIDEPRERRAQKMFQVHSEQLKRYYDQALQQRGYIFITGVLCILAGFAVIAIAFWLLVSTNASNTVKVLIGALGAVGGILGNFIAVVYLRMFTETVKSVGSFHDRLVTTHHLHFANFLIAKISSSTARDAFFGAIAKIIAADDHKAGGDATSEELTKKPKKKSASGKDVENSGDARGSEAQTNIADSTE